MDRSQVLGTAAAVLLILSGAAAEEQQLAKDLTVEQARWVDINQRLDELERGLSRKR